MVMWRRGCFAPMKRVLLQGRRVSVTHRLAPPYLCPPGVDYGSKVTCQSSLVAGSSFFFLFFCLSSTCIQTVSQLCIAV